MKLKLKSLVRMNMPKFHILFILDVKKRGLESECLYIGLTGVHLLYFIKFSFSLYFLLAEV